MRAFAIVLIFLAACGGKQAGQSGGPSGAADVFPAARWVPAQPTYVLSTRSMADAQLGFRELVDLLGMALGGEVAEVSAGFTRLLGVDPMSRDAVAGIGVDLEGSMVVFSEDINPTFVVHLDAPEAMAAFLDRQRELGLRTQSVVVAGTEVFTSKLASDAYVSWAVDDDWLWVHFAFDHPDGTTWFEHSKAPTGGRWVDGWRWAQALSGQAPALAGIFDLKGMLAPIVRDVPEAVECARKLDPIRRVGLAFDTDGKRVAGKVALDLGAATEDLAHHVLATPPGWTAASANAAMAAQWNLDLRVAAGWVQSCFVGVGAELDAGGKAVSPSLVTQLDTYGVRTGRAFLHSLDPDEKEGTGAVALDLSHAKFFRAQLDQIPGRGTFERARTFGIYKGKHLSVPFVGKGDYVLDDNIAIAAMGDGLLERIGSGAAGSSPPVVSIDLRPPGLSREVWQWLLEQVDAPRPQRFAERLMSWSELHVGARVDGASLVIEAAGNRR